MITKTEQTELKVNGMYRCWSKGFDTEIMVITEIGTEIGVPTLYGKTLLWLTNNNFNRTEHWSYGLSGVNTEEGYKFKYLGQKDDFPEYFL